MKLLILGRDGQVGTALTQLLAPLGTIVALGRDGADLANPDGLARVVDREQPDVIVNAGAYTAVDRAESETELAQLVNADGPGALARVAAELDAWLIHYSTDYVFDGEKSEPYVEDDATAPLNVYGATKRAGELAIGEAGSKHLIFRTSWVHAPGRNNFIAKILSLAQSRDELKVIDDQIGAPTSARLIAEVTARALEQIASDRPLPSGIYHLAAAGETSWHGYASYVIGEARRRGVPLRVPPERVLPVPSTAFPSPARRPHNSRLSTHKLRTALGIDLPDWQADVLGTLDNLLPETTR
ncbi:MAG TPA: dTDP-4-dehydrorhamnose reductase [Devosia sp.]|jgi:dTDP-4-dehydrorhamnose reductase|uniref:dTDP-4-dehydrorhamnose reductase n=1 Tax=Devosia sp. TaxID=1871048 RepID=UPI002DDCDE31|nr:dTDP-4-dehydrorhamnose reductase [Devosia sp.]HEV2516472.1 dTDP-4-dehydrorhamnose reductase [Devosia sp.]